MSSAGRPLDIQHGRSPEPGPGAPRRLRVSRTRSAARREPVAADIRWMSELGRWKGDLLSIGGDSFENEGPCVAVSEMFHLIAHQLVVLEVEAGWPDFPLRLDLVRSDTGSKREVLTARLFDPRKDGRIVLPARPSNDGPHRLEVFLNLSEQAPPKNFGIQLGAITKVVAKPLTEPERAEETALPHWTRAERLVHRACRHSRRFNTVVSALELRAGRTELLSLPQYMAFCPTGRCNALCDFCSVTINRTGIVKKELPQAAVGRFLGPVANTVRMYGLEGNGEPTLFAYFDQLVSALLDSGADAYLITNASRLTDEQLSLLCTLESINVSLNAATATTHRRVMKLKNFEDVISNIREVLKRRGVRGTNPQVSVSFVVNRYNIHETLDFVRFAEFDLGVDRILVRPLSELGNDLGTVEDLRDIVPFESEVRDMIQSIENHLADTAEERKAQIVFDPTTFNAVRPDPGGLSDTMVGENRSLLVPRRQGWKAEDDVHAIWKDGRTVTLRHEGSGRPGEALRSQALRLPASERVFLSIEEADGANELAFVVRDVLSGEQQRYALDDAAEEPLEIETPSSGIAELSIAHHGRPFKATIRFAQTRTPPEALPVSVALSRPRRWERCTPEAFFEHEDGKQSIEYRGDGLGYLAKSYSFPCAPGSTLELDLRLSVRRGHLGIGILDEHAMNWVQTLRFEEGEHASIETVSLGQNTRFQLAVYAAEPGGVEAMLDWTGRSRLIEPEQNDVLLDGGGANYGARPFVIPEGEESGHARPAGTVKPSSAGSGGPSTVITLGNTIAKQSQSLSPPEDGLAPSARPRQPSLLSGLLQSFRRDPEVYCHKPWTDLHNFSVDGRMDVCCIATGPSQERYQLGNMTADTFQDVWNGPVAQEFRRTVNDAKKALPPCQRCPMSHAYQGPLFDPERTAFRAFQIFTLQSYLSPNLLTEMHAALLKRTWYSGVHFALFLALYTPFHLVAFRRFKGGRTPPYQKIRQWYGFSN